MKNSNNKITIILLLNISIFILLSSCNKLNIDKNNPNNSLNSNYIKNTVVGKEYKPYIGMKRIQYEFGYGWEYQKNMLSTPNDFKNMEYVLLVKLQSGHFGVSREPFYDYYFVGAEYSDFTKGKELYENFNRKYLTKKEITKELYKQNGLDEEEEIEFEKEHGIRQTYFGNYDKMFSESRIVKKTTDASKVLREETICFPELQFKYDLFYGDDIVYVHNGNLNTLPLVDNLENIIFMENDKEKNRQILKRCNLINKKTEMYPISQLDYDYLLEGDGNIYIVFKNNVLKIFSIFNDLLYEEKDFAGTINFINKNTIVFVEESNEEWLWKYYKVDLNSGKKEYLFTKPIGKLSPNLEYLACPSFQQNKTFSDQGLLEYTLGVTIHDLKNDKIVFYPSAEKSDLFVNSYFIDEDNIIG